MKQIFDWLREQIETRKGDAETRMYRLIDEDRGDRCVYSETDVEEFSVNTWADALSILDEAEDKWESDCCEWKRLAIGNSVWKTSCGKQKTIILNRDETYCPYCGKPIKISEVE